MIALILLLFLNLVILYKTREPQELVEVKEKYRILREHIRDTGNEKYKMLIHPTPITGMKKMKDSRWV